LCCEKCAWCPCDHLIEHLMGLYGDHREPATETTSEVRKRVK
jgi:hypothetical protein